MCNNLKGIYFSNFHSYFNPQCQHTEAYSRKRERKKESTPMSFLQLALLYLYNYFIHMLVLVWVTLGAIPLVQPLFLVILPLLHCFPMHSIPKYPPVLTCNDWLAFRLLLMAIATHAPIFSVPVAVSWLCLCCATLLWSHHFLVWWLWSTITFDQGVLFSNQSCAPFVPGGLITFGCFHCSIIWLSQACYGFSHSSLVR